MFEEVGSWVPSYYLYASVMFVSGVIVLVEYLVLKYKTSNRDDASDVIEIPTAEYLDRRRNSSCSRNISFI